MLLTTISDRQPPVSAVFGTGLLLEPWSLGDKLRSLWRSAILGYY
jgi:hypothetical protein